MLAKTLTLAAIAALTVSVSALPEFPRPDSHGHARAHIARSAAAQVPTTTTSSSSISSTSTSSSTGGASNPTGGSSLNTSTTATITGPSNVVYWGQGSGERDLSGYCANSEGIDIIVMAFIYDFGSNPTPSGTFGSQCATSQSPCTALETDIKNCKAAGKKIFVSLGGAAGSYGLPSQGAATTAAQNIWDMFGNPSSASNKNIARPFGQQYVDGFDLDIESNDSAQNENYQYFVSKLRTLFQADKSHKYYISGAPQCPIPEPNMGTMISESQFDLLFIQFYNNPSCSPNDGDVSGINFADWATYVKKGKSSAAKLFLGLPASPNGATGTSSGAKYFVQPSDLVGLVGKLKGQAAFGGVMMWDAAQSDASKSGGCTYAQNVHSILTKGKAC